MLKNRCKISLILFFIVFLSSCSNKPPILNTSLPLVNKTQSEYVNLNAFYQQFLNSSQTQTFDDVNNILTKDKFYLSALGSKCYKLSLFNKKLINSDLYTVCNSNNLWHLVPDILNSQQTPHSLLVQ